MKKLSQLCARVALVLTLLASTDALCPRALAQAPAATPASLVTNEQAKKLGGPKPGSATATPAGPAATTSQGEESGWMLRTAASLVGVVVLIVGVAFVVKKVARQQGGLMSSLGPGGRAPSGLLEVLGRYPIARGTTLVLLKVDRRVLLLCQASGRRFGPATTMSTLCEIIDTDEVASILVKARDEEGDSLAKKFESMLGSFSGRDGARTPTIEPKPTAASRASSTVADLLRGGARAKPNTKTAAPAKPLTKAQAIAALEARLQTLRTQGVKERAA